MITIVSAYRVCQKSPTTGVKMAFMQQFWSLQSKLNLRKSSKTPVPNKQFILDLQAWIQHLQSQGHLIILNLDNNEDLYKAEGSIHNLQYNPDGITKEHSSRPFPPTYIRGKKRIDYM